MTNGTAWCSALLYIQVFGTEVRANRNMESKPGDSTLPITPQRHRCPQNRNRRWPWDRVALELLNARTDSLHTTRSQRGKGSADCNKRTVEGQHNSTLTRCLPLPGAVVTHGQVQGRQRLSERPQVRSGRQDDDGQCGSVVGNDRLITRSSALAAAMACDGPSTLGEYLPGARPARYLCIKYLISCPRFILTLGSPPSRPH
jgi:hypothetical protein